MEPVMNSVITPICPQQTRCKCCGAVASRYGVVDFHKNCEIYRCNALDVSGVPIYYYRCPACRFIFTTAFDQFTHDDFQRYVYNEEYPLIDPDYQHTRPRYNASILCNLFSACKPATILDYGCGNGLLAQTLREAGFPRVDTYDPYVTSFSARPADRYDCVVCFEVIEHSTDPLQTLTDLDGFVKENGLIFLSTLVQPSDIEQQGLNWWYAGPRNAHISLHSSMSLECLARRLGMRFGSFNESYHLLFRQVPQFATHFLRAPAA
jgi:Methyltransferase domain